MSDFETYPSTCTITTAGTVDPDDPYGPPLDAVETTVACWIKREQKQVKLADGNYVLSTVTIGVPAGTVFPAGCTVQEDGASYGVLAARDELDAFNEAVGVKAYLG